MATLRIAATRCIQLIGQSQVKIVASPNRVMSKQILQSTIRNNCCRLIHTSPKHDSPKLVLLVLRPFIAGLTGRIARWYWARLPKSEKARLLVRMKRHRMKLYYAIAAYGAAVLIYWLAHYEETPITKRKRFMAFTAENLRQISDASIEELANSHQKRILPAYDWRVGRVMKVARQLVAANRTLPHVRDEKITVTVIDEPGMANAMVTSHCKIIVFADMLDQCTTDDELAIVLAHELAHAVLDHVAEKISNMYLVGFFTAPIVAALWFVMPTDWVAMSASYFFNKLVEVAIDLPYSRFVETEADELGLEIAAKACFDVTKSVNFWLKMDQFQKQQLGADPNSDVLKNMEYLQTHPNSENRAMHLKEIMGNALKVRSDAHCPPIKKFQSAAKVQIPLSEPFVIIRTP